MHVYRIYVAVFWQLHFVFWYLFYMSSYIMLYHVSPVLLSFYVIFWNMPAKYALVTSSIAGKFLD